MKEWLAFATEASSTTIKIIALVVVVVGTAEAAWGALRLMFGSQTGHLRREIWLNYAHWLVAALTFQLASDIIETTIVPSWDEVLKLGLIAVVRTLLNYFLERDLSDVRDRQKQAPIA